MGPIKQFWFDVTKKRSICTGYEFKPEQRAINFIFPENMEGISLSHDAIPDLLGDKKNGKLVRISNGAFVPKTDLQLAYSQFSEKIGSTNSNQEIDALLGCAPASY